MRDELKKKLMGVGLAIFHEIRSFTIEFIRVDILRHAYAMSYVSLLSLIPSLAAIFAVLSLFSPLFAQDSNLIQDARKFVLEHLATASGEQAIVYIENFLRNLDIKKIGITGFAGTLVTLALLLKHIEVALNHIFHVNKARPIVTRFVNFWTFLTLGSFSMALFVTTLTTYASDSLQLGGNLSQYANRGILVVLFTLIYKLVPNCWVSTLWSFVGGLLSTSLLTLCAYFLKSYIILFSNYEAIYGAALAAIPIFLLWLYLIWTIILLGAMFTWRMQNRLRRTRDEVGSELEDANQYIQSKMKAQLPFLVLELCFESFESASGQGLKLHQISDTLQVPTNWVEEAVDLLLDRGFIVKDLEDPEWPRVYPKQPPQSISPSTLLDKLNDQEFQYSSEYLRLCNKLQIKL